jgi:hypothetical protein
LSVRKYRADTNSDVSNPFQRQCCKENVLDVIYFTQARVGLP